MGGGDSVGPATALTKKDFGRVLTTLRESAGLTVRELARKADVPAGTVSGWCTGRHLPTLTQKEMFLRLLATCGVTDGVEMQEWAACWLRLRRPLGQKEAEAPTPYRGLEPFHVEHARWFFGRSRLTETLVRRVTTGSPGLVVVVGPSGSGKSSVLRAGLIATLCGNAPARDRWQGVLLTPGRHPVAALAAQLAVAGDMAAEEVEADLWTQPGHAARRIRQQVTGRLLVVVDQFEEVFTACTDTAEQAAFLAGLQGLSDPADDAEVRVVAGLRADFYPDALRWPLLAQALQDSQVTVGPLTENELRQAIVEPARLAGMEFESGLAHLLLRDLVPAGPARETGNVNALPLLSHALLATWEQGGRRAMTIADYTATGGIHGAIGQTADAVFADLTDAERALVRRLFLRLVHVGDNTPDTRRRVQLDELTGGQGDGQSRDVLGRYVDQRLLTADADGVEISHEALLQAWPRLRHWIDTDRSGHRLHRQLTEAAQQWDGTERDPDALYRGVRLDAAVDWVTNQDHRGELNRLEQEFFDASVQASRAERLRERHRTRRLRWLAAALGVLLVVSVAATGYSIQQTATADRERNSAISRQLAGTANRLRDSDPALAAQLAVAAYRFSPTVEARSSVLAASGSPRVTRVVRPSGTPQAVALNPAGTLLAATGAARSDTEVLLWDLRDPNRPTLLGSPLTGHTKAIWAVAFSPDGKTLATGSADNTVRLWDVADAGHPKPLGEPLTGPQEEISALVFSPDGATLAVGSLDKTVRLWDVHDPGHPITTGAVLTATAGQVRSVAFTPTGNLLAIADEKRAVHLWNITDRQHPRPLRPPLTLPSRVNTVAFSPDGTTLAAGCNDGSVRLWTMTDPAEPTPAGQLTRDTGWIHAIAFSANGKMLAAASADASVQVWDLTSRTLRLDLPHAEPVTTVVFREQDQALYTNGADGIARRWLLPGPVLSIADRQVTGLDFHPHRPLLVTGGTELQLWDVTNRNSPVPIGPPLKAPPDSDRLVGTVAISPDGRTVAAATRAGNNVVLWDITTPESPSAQPVRLPGHSALIKHVAYNRRGDLLVSTSEDGTVRLWDMRDAAPAPVVLSPGLGVVFAAEFSLDDRLLVVATQSGKVALWDVRDPRHPTAIGGPVAVALEDARSLAISPDSRTLAIGVTDGTVRLWDVENPSAPAQLGRITGPDGYIHDVTFDSSGSMLIGGSAGQAWLWNVSDLRKPYTLAILQVPKTIMWKVQFSSDERTLATANGNIHLWDTDPERVIQEICTSAGDKITEPEWEKHVPGVAYQAVCP